MSQEAGQTVKIEQDMPGALRAGTRLRGYEILGVLGHGGFGITYRGRDTTLERDVAIKEYLPGALAVREANTTVRPRSTEATDEFIWGRNRFLDEARTLAKLEAVPAIVRVYDYLEANGTAYMVMALLDGEPLARRLAREGALSPSAIERLLPSLLDGLEAVHATGFLHRDIKPDNIMVDANGAPTLIDFGSSRAAIAGRSTPLTAVLTPGFAAVEQFTSASQGPWTDIYGLAATLYCAIAGRSLPSAIDRMLRDDYEPLAKLAPAGFSPHLLAGIDAGLAVRASDRPQSIAAWRAMLGSVALSVAPPVRQAAAPKRGIGVWAALAAAITVVTAGAGYWWAVSRSPATTSMAGQQAQVLPQAEAVARDKGEQDAAVLKRQVEEETRRKIEAELAEKQRIETEIRQRLEAEASAKREEEARTSAENSEKALNLTLLDRQHAQAALIAIGHGVVLTDGKFTRQTRDMIADYQRKRGEPVTGFLTGAQYAALLREAAAPIAQFDEEQKKLALSPPLEPGKRIVLTVATPGANCEPAMSYIARVFGNKLDLMFRGGWQSFDANAAGDFARDFTSPITGARLAVRGNLKTRAVSVENLRSHCLWKGSF